MLKTERLENYYSADQLLFTTDDGLRDDNLDSLLQAERGHHLLMQLGGSWRFVT